MLCMPPISTEVTENRNFSTCRSMCFTYITIFGKPESTKGVVFFSLLTDALDRAATAPLSQSEIEQVCLYGRIIVVIEGKTKMYFKIGKKRILCCYACISDTNSSQTLDFLLDFEPGMGTVPDFQERVPERSTKKNAILCDPGTPVPGLERPKIVRSPVLLRYLGNFKKRSSAILNF